MPEPRLPENPAATPRRTWPRLARVAVSLLALVLLGLALLHTTPGRHGVRVLIERLVARQTGGRLAIGALDYDLVGGTASARDVRLTREAATLEVEDVRVRWSPRAGWHLTLIRPVAVVRDPGTEPAAAPVEGLTAQPWRAIEGFGALEIVAGRLELHSASGSLGIGRLDASGRRGQGRWSMHLAVQDGSLVLSGRRLAAIAGRAELAVVDGRLAVDALQLRTEDSRLDLRGQVERVSPIVATATFRASAGNATTALALPDVPLRGRLRGDGRVAADRRGWHGTLRLFAPALEVGGIGPWDASLRARLDPQQLRIEWAEALGYGGRLTLEGPLATTGSSTTELDLTVEDIDAGALLGDLAARPVPVRSRLAGRLRYLAAPGEARGRTEGELRLDPAAGRPGIPLRLRAAVSSTGGRLRLAHLNLEARGASLRGELEMAEMAATASLRGVLQAELPLGATPALLADLGRKAPALLPVGRLTARVRVAGRVSDPLVEMTIEGEHLGTSTTARHATVSLQGGARYHRGRLALGSLLLETSGGGTARLEGSLPVAAQAGAWDVDGDLENLDLRPLLAILGVEADGRLQGHLRVEGAGGAPEARAELRARLLPAGSTDPVVVTMDGSASGAMVAVDRFEAELAGGRLRASGRYQPESRALAVEGSAEGLQLAHWPWRPAVLAPVDATVRASVSLSGTADRPVGQTTLAVSSATLDGAALPDLTLEAHADGRRLEVTGTTDDGAGATTFLRGAGTFESDWPLRLEIDTAALPLERLLEAIEPARQRAARVRLDGRIVVGAGLRDLPASLRYEAVGFRASGEATGIAWGTEPFGFQGSLRTIQVSGLRLAARGEVAAGEGTGLGARREAARGSLALDGRVAIDPAESFDLTVTGDVSLGLLQAFGDGRRLGGRAWVDARIRGTAEAPQVEGQARVEEARGRIDGLRFGALSAQARLAGDHLVLERFGAQLLGGRLEASGTLPLRRMGGDRVARLGFEATDLDLSRLVLSGVQRDPETPSFLVSVAGQLEAGAPALEALRGSGRITRMEQRSPEGTIGLVSPSAWSVESGLFIQEPLRLAGPLGTLEASGRVALGPEGTSGSAALAGPFDLRLLSPFLPDTTLGGPARADLRASWDQQGTRLDGRIEVEDGRLTLDTVAFTATRIRGQVELEGHRARLSAMANSGEGRLALSGELSITSGLPGEVTLEFQRVPISYPEGFRARASGTLRLSRDGAGSRVRGEVGLSQAYWTAEFDQQAASLDRLDQQLAALQGGETVGDRLPLGLRIRFDDPLRIRNRQARLEVTGAFEVGGTLAQPIASGGLDLIDGGQLVLRRARIRTRQGRVELNGYPSASPAVDLPGLTSVSGIEVELRARGTFEDLQLDLVSPNRPELSQTDLVSLLLTGRTVETAAAESRAVVTEELAAALSGVLQRNLGQSLLVDVASEQSLLAEVSDPTQRFNVGLRLRQDLIVLYSTRFDGSEQRWILGFNPRGGRLRLRLVSDETEGISYEASHRWSFDRPGIRTRPERRRQRVEVAAIRFEGALPLPEEELRRAAGVETGRRYRALRIERGADGVRAALVRAGWRGASVEAETRAIAGRDRTAELVLRVDAGPKVDVRWSGDDPGRDLRAATLDAWPRYASPEAAGAAMARWLRTALRARRFYQAKVEARVATRDSRAEVGLAVELGPRGRGVSVSFTGNTALDAATLLAALPEPGSEAFFEALESPGRFAGPLRLAYARAGHLRTRVGRPRQAYDPLTGRLEIAVRVREREASMVASVGLPESARGADGPRLTLAAGEPFDLASYLADRDTLAAWYRRQGWSEARVRGVLEPSSGGLAVSYLVEPGPRARVGEVRIATPGRPRESLLRRAVAAEPGAWITPQTLAGSRERLSELGLFRSVEVQPRPAENREGVSDLVVSYVERPALTVEYGLRYTPSGAASVGGAAASEQSARLQFAGALELADPIGWGWRLRPYAFVSGARHTWGLSAQSATLFGLRLPTQLAIFDDSDNRSDEVVVLAERVRGFTVRQQRVLLRDPGLLRRRDRLRLQWGYTLQGIEYDPRAARGLESSGQPPEPAAGLAKGSRAFVSLSLIGDERDALTDPRRGWFWSASADLAHRALGSDADYLRLYGQAFAFVPLGERLVWAQALRAGVVPGRDPLNLLENRFQAGGPTTVRGFGQNDLGPQVGGAGLGGQALAVVNQELRFSIWRQLKGGVFWDAGNVWATSAGFSLSDLRQSVGGGLRLMFPFGPIRLEYAWVIDPRPGETEGRLVFGLGHAF